MAEEDWKSAIDHSWKYFELHAGQRMTVFNYFIVLSGIIVTGIAGTVQLPYRFSVLGTALGFTLSLLSFVFWKLDQRAAFLVKHAEAAHIVAESKLFQPGSRIFAEEPTAHERASEAQNILIRPWTFGRSFRLVFVVMGLIGVIASAVSTLRFLDKISWEVSTDQRSNHGPQIPTKNSKDAGLSVDQLVVGTAARTRLDGQLSSERLIP